ncbi:RIO kinase 2 [Methanococcus maripaludis]|uniref:non-specific serine/threonine protein kinase n=1 Tax=Methanococcus maripaludis TaxID=39152 RepID=A0A7J9NVU4_METMI|nr:RIO1 family regulatory kinase/ATPase [Methanococcus maripaludis]MBA2847631.1 RIO kinase 2 [Methanococcus maripaludis]
MEDNDWKLLKIIEISMKNHEWVPIQDLRRKTGFHEKEIVFRLGRLNKFKFTNKSNYGYRLSHWGYDALAMNAFIKKELIAGIGGKVGVGKEGDVYHVLLTNHREAVLKFHQLGRTCFSMGKRYREYLANKRHISWLYASRLTAAREFEVLNMLFPVVKVPEPIEQNRHAIIMGKLHGEELKRVNLHEINVDPEEFFWKLMAEVKKTYNLGIIHGDLSEFNILIDSEGDFVIIDWPQAIEVGKKGKLDKLPFEEVEYDEEYYLKRDLENLLRYFKKYGIDKDMDKLYNYVIGDINSENI